MKKNVKVKGKLAPDINPIEHYNYIQESNSNIIINIINNKKKTSIYGKKTLKEKEFQKKILI